MPSGPEPAGSRPTPRVVLRDAVGVLGFRAPSAALSAHPGPYLALGLACTWLAGIGRYWDNPRAHLWQHAGFGSVAYVFVLALVLWLVVWPLRPARWSYRNVLLFVTLTAPPALLYAIPVERVLPLPAAQAVNAWFLALVATWRVALLVWFLRRVAGLHGATVVVATLLPLAMILVALTALNLEHVAFDLMAGNAPADRSPNDSAFAVVGLLSMFSILAAPVLLTAYAFLVVQAWSQDPPA